jgi:hypothetical protein
MEDNETRKLIHRLLSGYVFIGKYIIDIPSNAILAEADGIYEKCLYNNRFENMVDESRMEVFLMKNMMWTLSDKSLLEELPKRIEDAKVNLYLNALVPSQLRRVRFHLDGLKTEYNKLMTKFTVFNQYTIQSLANYSMELFIFSKIILNNEYEHISVQPMTVEKIIRAYKRKELSVAQFRAIARDHSWQNIWSTSGMREFRKIGEEQRQLVSYTQMYENIAKHPEAPSSAVINDDDMLDGWMIHIGRQYEKDKKIQSFDKTRKKAVGNEQFIMASSQEDVKSIMDMNDIRGKIIQQKIHTMVEKDGIANEFNIQELRQDANIINR